MHSLRRPSFLRKARFALVSLGLLLTLLVRPRASARADDVSPWTATQGLHREAYAELEAALLALAPEDRRRLPGVYLALDPDPADVLVAAACDDDGDDVVVMSVAALRSSEIVADAAASDELLGTHALLDYADRLDASSRGAEGGARPLPLPPGFFDRGRPGAVAARAAVRRREILRGLALHALALLADGALTCPRPTPTHERGDDEWTPAEHAMAMRTAVALYTRERVLEADRFAARALVRAGASTRGMEAWVTLFGSRRGAASSSYGRLHGDSAPRLAAIREAVPRSPLGGSAPRGRTTGFRLGQPIVE